MSGQAKKVLDCPMEDNDSGADTIRGYLIALLEESWRWGEDWVKRPFGNSGWQYDLYEALAKAGFIDGEFDAEDGYATEVDERAGHKLIADAIQELAKP